MYKVLETIFDMFVPHKLRKIPKQPPGLDEILPYEHYFQDGKRTVYTLSDFRYGVMWKLSPIAHELMPINIILTKLACLEAIIRELKDPLVTLQFIFLAEPSSEEVERAELSLPVEGVKAAQRVAIERLKHLASFKDRKKEPLMLRSLYLTLTVQGKSTGGGKDLIRASHEEGLNFKKDLNRLRDIANSIEEAMGLDFPAQNIHGNDFKTILRKIIHDKSEFIDEPVLFNELGKDGTVKECLRNFVNFTPHGVGVGGDTWEVLSWASQPEGETSKTLMVKLLELTRPFIAVVNLRGTSGVDLAKKSQKTRQQGDPEKEKINEELMAVRSRLVRGDELVAVSLHVLVRNIGKDPGQKDELVGEAFAKSLRKLLQIDFFVEKYAAGSVFLGCLPFGFSEELAGFIRRSKRVLSSTAVSYLPIYGGMAGAPYPFQMMLNRASELVSLDPTYSPTNQHMAILGGSGSGKSFFMTSLISAAYARDSKFTVFCIDNITSYEFLGRFIGEEVGFNLSRPPESYPNLFRGKLDEERLAVMLGVIGAAIAIVCGESLSATEQILLSDAIRAAYQQLNEDSAREYVPGETDGLGDYRDKSDRGLVRIPRLSDICENFGTVIREKEIPVALAESLRTKLLPFVGTGPYSVLFDRHEYEEEEYIAGFNLYDLYGIQTDEKLTTITSLLIVADVFRMMGRLQGSRVSGCKAFLIFEEIGVNLKAKNKELVDLVNSLVPTLRKRGIVCIGVGNKVEQYQNLPAARTIWGIAANKLIFGIEESIEQLKKNKFLEDLELDVVSSLKKELGKYSEALWINPKGIYGSFRYYPSGYEYWLAANEEGDVEKIHFAKGIHGTYQRSVSCLASCLPSGARNQFGKHRPLTDEERGMIAGWAGDSV